MICCVTGHRPSGFPFDYHASDPFTDDLRSCHFAEIYHNILDEEFEGLVNEGYTHFISGMADGADLDFAELVIRYREYYENIVLEAALPYPTNMKRLMDGNRITKADILGKTNLIHTVSDHYYNGCMQKRNKYMVDKCDLVFAIWNGEEKGGTWDTIRYARKQNKPIRYLMLNDIAKMPTPFDDTI